MSSVLTQLLRKYDTPGPRYTSYPTVPYWDDTPGEEQWITHLSAELEAARQRDHGAALYFHLPFCESLCTFCACNKIVTKKHEQAQPYIRTVLKEWALYREKLGRAGIPVSELHLGGGTPTFMSPTELQTLLEPIIADVDLTEDAELSLEADPRTTTEDHLKTLSAMGFRRISLGIQDYDPRVQKAINRVQSVDMVARLSDNARAHGFTGVNFDLVYGLPHQTLESIEKTFDHVVEQRPDRIAFYAYAHVPWVGKTGQRGFDENDLARGDAKHALYARGRELLFAAGYREIGMDHFALEHDPLFVAEKEGTLYRNFMGYVPSHISPLIGLGITAISDSWTALIQNEKSLADYTRRIESGELAITRGHVLTEEDLLLRKTIIDLMTRFHADTAPLEGQVSLPFQDLLQEARNDDLVSFEDHAVNVSDRGKTFIRNICMAFDARLQRKKPDTQIFSRTI